MGIYKYILLRCCLVLLMIVECAVKLSSQHYVTLHSYIYNIELNQNSCNYEEIGMSCCTPVISGLTFTPDSLLIALGSDDLWLINQNTGAWSQYFSIPPSNQDFHGLVSVGNGIFYIAHSVSTALYELNVNNGTYVEIGSLSFPNADIALFDGDMYF